MLTTEDLYTIEELAKEKRRMLELGMGPLGDNLFKVLRTLGIQLIQIPFSNEENESDNPLAALYLSSKEEDGYSICYIGLNTSDYWDKQIFALAHELYHHFESSDPFVLCRGLDHSSDIRELKANRFAAEFLLPTEKLIHEIKEKNRGNHDLKGWSTNALLRLIAEVHCDYRLPFKAIVRRLLEVGAISKATLENLLKFDARDSEGIYYTLGANINLKTFQQLNSRTNLFGVEGENLGKLIENYEEGKVSLSELSDDLSLFGKSLDDYKLMESSDSEDDDLALLFEEEED
ncbi:ImmA/IrrE family metallo-endopeptidase [Paenibacillus taichungensis]|uniref:ImmA/IrrE family metallo-endopeptidase n=1 Tax=Paenibacillus taichungensis TaxID=484184 RepID=UPI0038D01534